MAVPIPPASSTPDGEHARRLVRVVSGLGTSYGLEKSFRVTRESVSARRFLLSVCAEALGTRPSNTLAHIGDDLMMPRPLQESALRWLRSARFVHFGFEHDGVRPFYKVYLEQMIEPGRADGAVLLHYGFKWNPERPGEHAVTRYDWHRGLSVRQILGRLDAVYHAEESRGSFEVVADLIKASVYWDCGDALSYLEVTEEGNPRASYDINFYALGLTMGQVAPTLVAVARRLGADGPAYRAFCRRLTSLPFGHLAGGLHRDGREFFSVYYGVEPRESGAAAQGGSDEASR